MKKLYPVFLIGGLTAIGLSLYRYYKRQIDFLKDIQYRVTGIKVISISKENVTLEIATQIYNSSNVEATVTEINLDVLINGINTGKIREAKEITILPRSISEFSFQFNFNPSVIGQNILNLLTLSVALKDVIISVQGDLKIKSAFVNAYLPFEYRNNLSSILKR